MIKYVDGFWADRDRDTVEKQFKWGWVKSAIGSGVVSYTILYRVFQKKTFCKHEYQRP